MTYHRFLPLPTALAALMLSLPAAFAAVPAPSAGLKVAAVAPKALPKPVTVAKADTSVAAAPVPAPAPLAGATAPTADDYTGILIDARGMPGILRSPAPAIYGPEPDEALLYPDRSHVPTPDDVQDESIVRYYHNENDAEAGVAGSHPLVLKATAVLGYAKDALQLSAVDVVRLQDLEKKLHFTQTWKVGFLIPAGQ